MAAPLLEYEAYIRFAIFGVVFALMAAWELLSPRRHQAVARGKRWAPLLRQRYFRHATGRRAGNPTLAAPSVGA